MMNFYCNSHNLWPSLYAIPVIVNLSIMYVLKMDIYDITILSDVSISEVVFFYQYITYHSK